MAKSTALTPMDDETIQTVVRQECENAVAWIESYVSPWRSAAERYYEGATAIPFKKGRSSVSVTTVRDSVNSILPSIGRVFTQTDTIGEFSSNDEEDEVICQEMTLFANSIFHKYGGYSLLVEAATDSFKSKIGVSKVTLEKKEIPAQDVIQNMTPKEYADYQSDIDAGIAGEVQITEVTDTAPDAAGNPQLKVTGTRKTTRNRWILECVEPEAFIVDSRCIGDTDNTRLLGIRQNMAIYEAVELGLDAEILSTFPSDDSSALQSETFRRRGFDIQTYNDDSMDVMNRTVLITELWMRIDEDGDGLTELRHIICAGPNYQRLIDEPAACCPISIWKSALDPHKVFPICLAEDLAQDQDSMTAMLRSIIDNAAFVNTPRTAYDDSKVNSEDLKNSEIGAMIRTQGPPGGMIQELTTPSSAGETLPVLEWMKTNSEARSGVTKLSQGLDLNALQATSRIAANAAVMGSDARIEMMVRNLGETGLKHFFKTIVRIAMYEFKGKTSIKTATGYKEINPAMWHDQINVDLTVGMGNGKIDEKMQTLGQISQIQNQAIGQYGPANPFAPWSSLRNTYKTMARLAGIKNISDYLPLVSQEQITAFQQQMDNKQQQAAQAQKGAPPAVPDVKGAAEVKAQSDMQISQSKIQAQMQADIQKLQSQHQLQLEDLKTGYMQAMQLESMRLDQRRDADNQKYAVEAFKAGLDAQTQHRVMMENAMNNKQGATNGST